jgi:hypothetical protein
MNSFNLLMQAQETCRGFPELYANPSNIIGYLVKGSFSVQFDGNIKDKVAKLFRAIQHTLVMLKSSVVKSNLPECFQHNIQQFRCQDCTTTTHPIKVKDTFIISVGEYKSNLQTKWWWSLEKLCPCCQSPLASCHPGCHHHETRRWVYNTSMSYVMART